MKKVVGNMEDIEKILVYGIIDNTLLNNENLMIKKTYEHLLKSDTEEVIDYLLEKSSLNQTGIIALLLLTKSEHFSEVFDKEIKDFYDLFYLIECSDILKINLDKPLKNHIIQWMKKHLNKEIIIAEPIRVKYLLKKIGFKVKKDHPERVKMLMHCLKKEKKILSREKALLKQKESLTSGKVIIEKEAEFIKKHHLGIKEIKNNLYHLTVEEKIVLIKEALRYTNPEDIRYLKEVFEKIPDDILNGYMNKIEFFDLMKIEQYIPITNRIVYSNNEVNDLIIIIDQSYSMINKAEEINLFLRYFKTRAKLDKCYLISDEIKDCQEYYEVNEKCVCNIDLINDVLSNTFINSHKILFITDGNIDLIKTENLIRSNEHIVWFLWFVDANFEKPSSYNNAYYFYGKAEKIANTFFEFSQNIE